MIGYILQTDGRVRKLKQKSKLKNKQISMILVYLHSELFGEYYLALTPQAYKKISKMTQSRISYDFLNGVYTNCEECEEDGLFEHIKYVFKIEPLEIFSKIYDICVAENILNDSFWIHSAFYTYIFLDLK